MSQVERTWVLAEQHGGVPAGIVLELLTAARGITGAVEVVTWGPGVSSAAGVLCRYGATTVYDAGDIGESLPGPKLAAAIAAQVSGGNRPDAILIGATHDGRDVAARLSVRLDLPVLANVVGLDFSGPRPTSEHTIFGGSALLRAEFTGGTPWLFLVQPKSFVPEPEPAGQRSPEIVAIDVPETGASDRARIVARHADEQSGPRLDEAAVVVSGGRGLGSSGNYALVTELAQLLNGAAGATRAIVDSGWVPYAYQIGQTGKTVRPAVYIACGISGATQHLVGMKDAEHIIAINKDREAPIFAVADLGVVGDVTSVLPKLIEAIKARR
ncbi:MAG: electron transfer flavoprotein subunit alpha/FixB family protein [Acidimicrobiales bacterium]|jgi:electron transfer flavoprotein alpha subunit